jgi:hypothetical protein
MDFFNSETSIVSSIRSLNTIILVSDNVAQFTSSNFRQMCFAVGIRYMTPNTYYPQPSHAERLNKNLGSTLIACYRQDHSCWDEHLAWLEVSRY